MCRGLAVEALGPRFRVLNSAVQAFDPQHDLLDGLECRVVP